MIIATELELFCTKDEILTMYANTVDFGSNAFGIKTAAKTYFNTTPAQLKTEEAAVLVGLLKATSAYNPQEQSAQCFATSQRRAAQYVHTRQPFERSIRPPQSQAHRTQIQCRERL